MDASHLVRVARRRTGLSQRDFARRAGIATSTVIDVEREATVPSVRTLERMLAAAGLELSIEREPPAPCRHLDRYLRMTLTERLYLAVGGRWHPVLDRAHAPWTQLWRLARHGNVRLSGAVAVGVWVPRPAVPPEVHFTPWPACPGAGHIVTALDHVPVAAELTALDVTVSAAPPGGVLVPVFLGGTAVLVPTPEDLLLAGASSDDRLPLRVAARLLHAGAGRDDASRRVPAHRDADRRKDDDYVMHTKQFGALRPPSAAAGRGWQLDGAVSLAQWLREHGYPT